MGLGSSKEESLKRLTFDTASPFTIQGKRKVKIVDVYSGDTIKVGMWFGGELIMFSAKLFGIDLEDVLAAAEDKKAKSIEQRTRLLQMLFPDINWTVGMARKDIRAACGMSRQLHTVECRGLDPWRCLMCLVYDECGRNVNHLLVSEGLAVEYFGRPADAANPICYPPDTAPTESATPVRLDPNYITPRPNSKRIVDFDKNDVMHEIITEDE